MEYQLNRNQLEILTPIYELQKHCDKELVEYSNTWNVSGWLLSGDIGYYDDDGNVFLVDRISEFILFYGCNISTAEIEYVLGIHPAVSQVAVIGLPHETEGQQPIAIVSRVPDKTVKIAKQRPFQTVNTKRTITVLFEIHTFQLQVTEDELHDLVAKNLPGYCKLRGGIKFLDKLPRTATGKIAKKQLRDMFAS